MKIDKNNRGVTLLELFITLAIAALVLMVGVPGFKSFFCRMEVRNGVRTVTVALNTARYKAIMTNKSVKFTMETDKIVLKEKRDGRWEGFLHFDLSEKVSFSINSSPVFTPFGSVAPLCSVYVSNEISQYKITLSIAGRLKVTEVKEK